MRKLRTRAEKKRRFRTLLSALFWSATVAGQAQAQSPADFSAKGFDAGFGTGGNLLNRPFSPMGGNPFATGNVRGGFALRSFSPISDPTAFRGSLGSGGLSNFIRDSVSVYDAYNSNRGLPYAPFYDPARTAPTAGFLSGQSTSAGGLNTLPGDFTGIRPSPGLLNTAAPTQRTLPLPDINSSSPPVATSTLGVMQIKPIEPSPLVRKLTRDPIGPRDLPNSARFPNPLASDSPLGRGDGTTRVVPEGLVKPLGSPLDLVLKGDSRAILERQMAQRPANPFEPPASDTENPAAKQIPPAVAALRDASMLPGNDVFTDMRLALSLVADPSASSVFQDMQKAARGTARQSGESGAKEIEAAVFIERLMKAPIKTFVGEGSSPVNDELLKAESLMQLGQFYDAAKRYERAGMLDPVNPLPLIGRGNALLAAGDYLSASLFLVRGMERFPEISRFDVDLRAFLQSGEIIDIRRAELMRELDRREDPTLRFLLGYLEYFTGDKGRGMSNLEKAAESAEPGTIIKRYPAMLKGEGTLPLPKLPDGGGVDAPARGTTPATPTDKEQK